MKLVHWPLMGGLLHLVQWGGDWKEPQPTQAPPRQLVKFKREREREREEFISHKYIQQTHHIATKNVRYVAGCQKRHRLIQAYTQLHYDLTKVIKLRSTARH